MTSLVPYFQVHQPFRLRRYTFFDIGVDSRWFDDAENERIVRRVAERCYVPMNEVLLKAIERTRGKFRCAFSISGTALDQMEAWAPDALDGFVRLARTGCVEFLAETSHHSLSFLQDDVEFCAQVTLQADRVERLFGRRPTTFRNTELVIDEHIAKTVEGLGFKGLLGEGADHLLGWRSAGRVYGVAGCRKLRLLLRNYRLSDDIAFRFSNRSWPGWPLTAEKFAASVHAMPAEEEIAGLFMDYETFGEHQWKETGIFEFVAHMPEAVLANPRFDFATPSEALARRAPVASLAVPHPVSWADAERDLTAWLGNPMQRAAHQALYGLLPAVRRADREDSWRAWRRLSTSDHLYYMCTKWFSDGDVHKHFSPYSTPHDAFIAYMNVLDDLERRLPATATPAPAQAGDEAARPKRRAKALDVPATGPSTEASPAPARGVGHGARLLGHGVSKNGAPRNGTPRNEASKRTPRKGAAGNLAAAARLPSRGSRKVPRGG